MRNLLINIYIKRIFNIKTDTNIQFYNKKEVGLF